MNSGPMIPQGGGLGLEANLGVKEEISRGEAVSVQFTLTNRSAEELLVLDWYTPIEGLAGDIFSVERDGQPVPYQGIMAKRGVPQAHEFMTIKPGEAVSAEIDLAEGYDLSLPGDYSIAYRSPPVSQAVSNFDALAKGLEDLGPVQIPSNTVTVRIVGTDEGPVAPLAAPDVSKALEAPKTITYDSCSASEESAVQSTDSMALEKSRDVYTYLKGLSESEAQTDALYKTWFGAYTADRYKKVLGSWQQVRNGFESSITYNCHGPRCKPSWYAYVYPLSKLEVFLCQQFWNAPDTGTDTKYGTLIHEVSHEVAGTKDHVYGQAGCKNLAQNSPDQAIENADNYEYYAEHFEAPPGPNGAGPRNLAPTLLMVGGALLAAIARRLRKRQ
jgi:peptidyl-Lys metalloendopeptidase